MTRVQGCGCTPYFPIRSWPYHSSFCGVTPRKPLTKAQEHTWRERNLAKIAARVPTLDELAESIAAHPSRKPLLRLVEDESYIEAHSDDEDDSGPRGIA